MSSNTVKMAALIAEFVYALCGLAQRTSCIRVAGDSVELLPQLLSNHVFSLLVWSVPGRLCSEGCAVLLGAHLLDILFPEFPKRICHSLHGPWLCGHPLPVGHCLNYEPLISTDKSLPGLISFLLVSSRLLSILAV
jgi:hypothetical protein